MQTLLAKGLTPAIIFLAIAICVNSFALLTNTYFEHIDRLRAEKLASRNEIAEPANEEVQIIQLEKGKQLQVFAFAPRYAEGSILLTLNGSNLKATPQTAKWRSFSRNDKDPIVILDPVDAELPITYDYKYTSHMGTTTTKPECKYQYTLPFEKDKKFMVTQGYSGNTHTVQEFNEYAVDLGLPEDTLVCAARDGFVVAFRDDSSATGQDKSYANEANYVTIRHNDGSTAAYAHLRKNGVLVKLGEKVAVGQAIGFSGNTGLTDGPHLHFELSYNDLDHKRHSLPVIFKTATGLVSEPKTGQELAHPASQ